MFWSVSNVLKKYSIVEHNIKNIKVKIIFSQKHFGFISDYFYIKFLDKELLNFKRKYF